MKNNVYQPGVLYSVDPDNRIGLVPASPLILPFLLIWGIVVLIKNISQWRLNRIRSRPQNIFETRGVNREQYERDRSEFLILVARKQERELDALEKIRLHELSHPWWAEPYECPIVYK